MQNYTVVFPKVQASCSSQLVKSSRLQNCSWYNKKEQAELITWRKCAIYDAAVENWEQVVFFSNTTYTWLKGGGLFDMVVAKLFIGESIPKKPFQYLSLVTEVYILQVSFPPP